MKRTPKPPSSQFTLSLYRQSPLQIDPSSKEGLLKVLADLMREALGVGQEPNNEHGEHAHESKDNS